MIVSPFLARWQLILTKHCANYAKINVESPVPANANQMATEECSKFIGREVLS